MRPGRIRMVRRYRGGLGEAGKTPSQTRDETTFAQPCIRRRQPRGEVMQMRWNKELSKKAVAAKAKRRMTEPVWSKERPAKVRRRREKAKWRLQLRDLEHGDSLTLRLYQLPWPARYAGGDGRKYSAAQIGKIVARILTQAP